MPSQPAPLPPIRLELLALQLHDGSEPPWDWLLITPPAGSRPTTELGPSSSSRFLLRPAGNTGGRGEGANRLKHTPHFTLDDRLCTRSRYTALT